MKDILVVAGPTAVGKTEYAISLAQRFNGEIVSCDSMQLYRFMNIGSAKPGKQELAAVKHYLVDEIDPREPFSVAQYQKRAKAAIFQILDKGKLPIISGGTGLYLNSLLYEMDFNGSPGQNHYRKELEELVQSHGKEALHRLLEQKDAQAAERIHPNNTKKIIRALETIQSADGILRPFSNVKKRSSDYRPLLIGLTRERTQLYDRINRRVLLLMEQGLLQEVQGLLDMGLTEEHISMKGIGYKELIGYLQGNYDLDTAISQIQQNTRHYAKRQLTWFRRYDTMEWFDLSQYESKENALEDISSWVRKNR